MVGNGLTNLDQGLRILLLYPNVKVSSSSISSPKLKVGNNFLIFGVPVDISKIIGLIGIIIFGVLFIRVEGSKKVKQIK